MQDKVSSSAEKRSPPAGVPPRTSHLARQLGAIAVAAALVKLLLFAVDPTPGFFLDDSCTYLFTALYKSFPLDRSFTYGYLIRSFCVRNHHSLGQLVLLQMGMGLVSAVVLGGALIRTLQVSFAIALASAILYCVEPIELVSEHFVMTEACSGLLLALFFLLSLRFVTKPEIWTLPALAAFGFALVSVRLANLPLVIVFSVTIPLAAFPVFRRGFVTSRYSKPAKPYLVLGLALTVSIGLTQFAMLRYRIWNGHVGKLPPAYGYADGLFLIADVAPLVRPVDEPDPHLRNAIFGTLRYPLQDRRFRPAHRWLEGGLVDVIQHSVSGGMSQGNQVAREIAVHAMRRDPIGLLDLASRTFLDYWNPDLLRSSAEDTVGLGRALVPRCLAGAKSLGYKGGPDQSLTPTKQWFLIVGPWYLTVLLTPALFLVGLPMLPADKRPAWILLLLASLIYVALACVLVERVTIRYLAPVAWLQLIACGVLAEHVRSRLSSKTHGAID